MVKALLLIVVYVAIVILPLSLTALIKPFTEVSFLHLLGANFALVAIVILFLQPVLAGRFKTVERPFGLDILIRYHKYIAVFAVALLICHPLLIAAGGGGLKLLTTLDLPWYILLGKATLILVIIQAGLSLFQPRLKLKFERWRLAHDILAPAIIVFAFTHSIVTGHDLQNALFRVLWIGFLLLALFIYLYHRFLRPRRLRQNAYKVVEVKQETHNVWTVKLEPPQGQVYKYLPGQFHFLTFHRSPDLPEEEHHWTISSSPDQRAYITSTIKESGDFTSTMGRTKPGDSATEYGPFGRFSYVLHKKENDLVFIAGGIGLTPLMSMLRYMKATNDRRSVILLYANKTERDILFREELNRLATGGTPRLKVIHILSQPGAGWTGPRGHIDPESLERHCGSMADKAFYVCGPAGLRDSVVSMLQDKGVRDSRIHLEVFSFLE